MSYYELDKYREAILNFNVALKKKKELPTNLLPSVYIHRGTSHYFMGQDIKAEKDIDEAFKLGIHGEQALLAYYIRGQARTMQKKCDLAIADLSVVISKEPRHHDALLFRSGCYYVLSKFDKAIEDIDRAIKIQPNNDGYRRTKATYLKARTEHKK
jgi:tetratricopeptide (TPR) repeat protein